MAGLGKKTFTTTLTAADCNGYLMDQTMFVFSTTTARDTAVPSPDEGMHCYITTDNVAQVYNGTAWVPLGGWDQDTTTEFLGAGNKSFTPSTVVDVQHDFTGVDAGASSDARIQFPYNGADALNAGIDANHAVLFIQNADTGDAGIALRQGTIDGAVFLDQSDSQLKLEVEGVDALSIDTSGVVYVENKITGADGVTMTTGAMTPDSPNSRDIGSSSNYYREIWAASFAATTTYTESIGFQPVADNTYDIGTNALRWDDIYATNGTIQTSDERFKVGVKTLTGEQGLEIVQALAKATVHYRRPRNTPKQREKPKKENWGFSWQRLEEHVGTDHAITVEADTTQGPHGARYEEAIAPLVAAVNYLAARVAELEAKQ